MANVTKKAIIDVEMNSLDADQRARAKRSAIIDIDIFGLSEVVEVGQTRFQGAFIGSRYRIAERIHRLIGSRVTRIKLAKARRINIALMY